jgi:hypothetical protein
MLKNEICGVKSRDGLGSLTTAVDWLGKESYFKGSAMTMPPADAGVCELILIR